MLKKETKERIHQMVAPILNTEYTDFCNEYLFSDSIFTQKTEKKTLFWTNKKFAFFSSCSNWEKLVEKISETNWWKDLMNSLKKKLIQILMLYDTK